MEFSKDPSLGLSEDFNPNFLLTPSMIKTDAPLNLDRFLRDRCEIAPEFQVAKNLFYGAYISWLQELGEKELLSKYALSKEMTCKGFTEVRNKFSRNWGGISLIVNELPGVTAALPKIAKTLDEEPLAAMPDEVSKAEPRRVHFPRNDALDILLRRAMGDDFPRQIARKI